MIVRLLKSYTVVRSTRVVKFPIGKVMPRGRKEAERMIKENIAVEYSGPFPPRKMKTNFFKP
jgi:hypothetical protein